MFGPNDPDPHGMCIHDNHVYFTDAGLGGGRKPSAGTKPQMIFRFPLTRPRSVSGSQSSAATGLSTCDCRL